MRGTVTRAASGQIAIRAEVGMSVYRQPAWPILPGLLRKDLNTNGLIDHLAKTFHNG